MNFLQQATLLYTLMTLRTGQFLFYVGKQRYIATVSSTDTPSHPERFTVVQAFALVTLLQAGLPVGPIQFRIGTGNYNISVAAL